MQLPLNTKIAGRKTVKDWNEFKIKLLDFDNDKDWKIAYRNYYSNRLHDRYLAPIETIKCHGTFTGEGFSIMAIICSLIEFLESTYQGKNYRYKRKGDPPLSAFEYSGSEAIFVSFLTQHLPFDKEFDKESASEFYKSVRCGLLHEARTKGNWKIKGAGNKLFEKKTDKTIVIYRNPFLEAIHQFIKNYEVELYKDVSRKEAFIRKLDNLCEM
jgi:hypothetical protein